jgi:hypothetical protein
MHDGCYIFNPCMVHPVPGGILKKRIVLEAVCGDTFVKV